MKSCIQKIVRQSINSHLVRDSKLNTSISFFSTSAKTPLNCQSLDVENQNLKDEIRKLNSRLEEETYEKERAQNLTEETVVFAVLGGTLTYIINQEDEAPAN